jgi:hypothetical protein
VALTLAVALISRLPEIRIKGAQVGQGRLAVARPAEEAGRVPQGNTMPVCRPLLRGVDRARLSDALPPLPETAVELAAVATRITPRAEGSE